MDSEAINLEEVPVEELAARAQVSFAGPETQAWFDADFCGMSIESARTRAFGGSADGDMSNVDMFGLFAGWGSRDVRRLERSARGVVGDVWDSIVVVAEALDECGGVLSGSQVYSLA